MNPNTLRTLTLLVAASTSVGCASSKDLLFTTYTKVGVDISAVNGTPTEAVLGYKRFEGAIIPVDPEHEPAKGDPRIPSLYASMDFRNGWLSGLCIAQMFATGQAALNATENTDKLPVVPTCKKHGEEQ